MYITQKFFPNGDMDKLKARLVVDGSQQGHHLYDFVSSATISLHVAYFFSTSPPISTVYIRGAFLNAEFTPVDSPIYLKINKGVVPYLVKQDHNAVPYVSTTGELIFLIVRFLNGL